MVAKSKGAAKAAEASVEEFLRTLDHPLKREVETLRRIVLAADPTVRESIKWNAPSFLTTEHFATFNLHAKDRVRLIFHAGAKAGALARTGVKVDDPRGLLQWPAKDRAVAEFASAAEVEARRDALTALVRAWVAAVTPAGGSQ